MELHIKSEFDCVYLINGELVERADAVCVAEFDVVYVTVLPLRLNLLPYTVRLCGAENVSGEVYSGIRLDENNYLLSLSPRYMTVYCAAPPSVAPSSPIARLFSLVKNGDLGSAYAMLSEELRSNIDKNDLNGFFADFERIAECTWENSGARFYLIDKNGGAKLHSYSLRDEFIDDIVEVD